MPAVKSIRRWSLWIVVALAVTACSDGGGGDVRSGGPAAPPLPTTSPVTAAGATGDIRPPELSTTGLPVVVPRPGMINLRSAPVIDVFEGSDGRTLELTFVGPGGACWAVDRVEVNETPLAVEVVVWQGTDPDLGSECDDTETEQVVVAHLEQPWGERELIDGSDDR